MSCAGLGSISPYCTSYAHTCVLGSGESAAARCRRAMPDFDASTPVLQLQRIFLQNLRHLPPLIAQALFKHTGRRSGLIYTSWQTDGRRFFVQQNFNAWTLPSRDTSALVSRDSSIAHFSDLFRQIDILDNKLTLFSITKRVQLAAMAQ